ncbi:hypothetical protein QFZ81_000172 [Paenibacillus sp. V4I9]|uniref:hypothetical protein n=1 Tax=Paenibacillus sp. V4I9 TaxID=3042308 RepID=UPI00277DB9C8|nr:hypothetical protein [Paenibacillus sp. V4I9]MDQ0885084.1 hypothetical protein [Paenibacillus sp. V4I9]
MVTLNNYSTTGTYIIMDSTGYSIVEKDKVEQARQGVGGFSEDGQLLGIYVEANEGFFLYNDNNYKINPDNIICSNIKIDNGERCFRIEINNQVVCDITYKPFISPLLLAFEEDEEEFDFLLYLSSLLLNKDTISFYIRAMSNIK